MKIFQIAAIIMSLALACAITSCGGGGGSDSDTQAANPDQTQIDNPFSNGDDSANSTTDDTADDNSTQGGGQVPVKVSTSTPAKTMKIGKNASVIIHASGGSGDYNWTLEGELPEGMDIENVNSKTERIGGAPEEAGTFTVTVTAKDIENESNSASVEITLKVTDGQVTGYIELNIPKLELAEPIQQIVATGDCSDPLTIELVKFDPHTDMSKGEWTVPLGGSDQKLNFKVTGGKAPYTWSLESKVEKSYYCHTKGKNAGDPGWTYRFADEGSCNNADEEGALTGNATWKDADKEKTIKIPIPYGGYMEVPDPAAQAAYALSSHEEFNLQGAFKYNGPLPISILDKEYKGKDYEPVEELTVKVADSCNNEQTKTLKFRVKYPTDSVDEIKAAILYQDVWGMDDGSSFTALFLSSDLSPHDTKSLEDDLNYFTMYGESGASYSYYNKILELSATHAAFQLKDLKECKDGVPCYASAEAEKCKDEWDQETSCKTKTEDIDRIILLWNGLYKESEGPCIPITKDFCMINPIPGPYYDDIDLRFISFRTPHWEATYDDGTGDLFNEDITKTVTRVDDLSDLTKYPGMSAPDPKKIVFHRREMPEY